MSIARPHGWWAFSQAKAQVGKRVMDRQALTAAHWRDRAEEARGAVTQLYDLLARRDMLSIAEGYDRMARRLEALELAGEHKPSRSCEAA